MTYKADQLQPVSNMIRIPNIVSAHPSTGIKSIAGTDRLHQGQSGQADLRLLRRRAEPSPHRRLVPATHRAEDGACAVPRRRSGAAGGAGRRHPDPVRQSLSDAAAGAGRQAHRARGDHAGAQRVGAEHPDHARERAGACEVRRLVLVRHLPAEGRARARRRCAQQGDQGDAGARGHQDNHRQDGRHAPTGARRSNSPISCRRRPTKFAAIIKRKACRWT